MTKNLKARPLSLSERQLLHEIEAGPRPYPTWNLPAISLVRRQLAQWVDGQLAITEAGQQRLDQEKLQP
jgi:hypothetical protein